MDWIKPFRRTEDNSSTCIKCCSGETITHYHPAVVVGECDTEYQHALQLADDPTQISDMLTEHLCRACLRCGYTWCERTADYEQQ
ncbi:hypothetical protein [Kitasatospora viridis]|uniref:Uncharacterized protein n=1 Tax=Kitasatospora viridis TaxID=281105 RepID=A0A561SAF9_9ACTN|nr:hypothetical protein [Kitasatospora viridis]TWF71794.1 hypothetical protein FHX73_18165 [Kitasatospora viridis]